MTDSAPEAVIEAMARAIAPRAWLRGYTSPNLKEQARALARAALSAASRAGFVLVPVEATEESVEAMTRAFSASMDGETFFEHVLSEDDRNEMRRAMRAALAARPGAAPTKQEE